MSLIYSLENGTDHLFLIYVKEILTYLASYIKLICPCSNPESPCASIYALTIIKQIIFQCVCTTPTEEKCN